MSAEVRRRLEALERAPEAGNEPMTILVSYVTPGEPVGEASSLRSLDGVSVDREADESESAFIARVASLVRGADNGLVVLFAGSAEPAAGR